MRFSVNKIFSLFYLILLILVVSYRHFGNIFNVFDLTSLVVTSLIVSFVTYSYKIISKFRTVSKYDIKLFLICLLSSFYLIGTLIWSRNKSIGLDNLILFFSVFYACFFSYDVVLKNIKSFAFLIIVFSVYASIISLINNQMFFETRLRSIEDANPITFAKFIGLSVISLFYFFLNKKFNVNNLIGIGVLILLLISIFMSGSKGPFFSLLITFAIIKFVVDKKNNFLFVGIFILLLWVFSSSLISLLPQDLQLFFNNRFNIEEDVGGSVSSRMDMIIFTISNFYERGVFYTLFGNGASDFEYTFMYASYPHNILLEILFEYGLIGLFYFSLVLVYIYKMIKSYSKLDLCQRYLITCILYLFLTALTSGNIASNFLFFALICYLYIYNKKIKI